MTALSSFQIRLFLFAIAALFITGLYTVIVTRNMIRTLLGLELITKAVTLLLVLAGYLGNRTDVVQAMVITVIIVEVVVTAVAAGIVIRVFHIHGSLSTRNLRNLKG